MNQNQLEQFIEDSFKDGYSIDEIIQSLKQQGVEEANIQRAVKNLRNELRQQNNQTNRNSPNNQKRLQTSNREHVQISRQFSNHDKDMKMSLKESI